MPLFSISTRSLKTKVLGAALLSLVCCMSIVWFGNYQTSLQAGRQGAETNLRATYRSSRSRLLEFHNANWRHLGLVSRELEEHLGQPKVDDKRIAQLLHEHHRVLEFMSEIFVTDLDGEILYSTAPDRAGSTIERKNALRAIRDRASQYLDGPYPDPITEQLGPTTSKFHDSITLMYTNVIRYEDDPVAVLMARLPNDVQSDLIQQEDSHIYKSSGDTYIFMVKSDGGVGAGVALSRSRFEDDSIISGDNLKTGVPTEDWGVVKVDKATELELVFKDPATGALTEGVRRIVETGQSVDGTHIGYPDYRHVPVVGVGGTFQVPGSSDLWGMVAEADVGEAYSDIHEANAMFAKLAFPTAVVACILVAFVVIRPMNSLRALLRRIGLSSVSVTDAAGALDRSATSLSGSAADQTAAIVQTVSSIEEIAAMVTSNNDSAAEVLSLTQETSSVAEVGVGVVGEMTEAMGSIASQNSELVQVVDIIDNISSKTRVINDIVFETKLLSFNASIEAARAGEHGRGFAVVAEEVGNLARLSGKAAQEIRSLIEQSTKQVQAMVTVTKDSVAEGVLVTKRCSDSFEEISTRVNKVASMMESIALSSNEQSLGVAQVSKAMEQMDALTQVTATAAHDAAEQSGELRSAGDGLSDVVDSLHNLIDGDKPTGGSSDAGSGAVGPKSTGNFEEPGINSSDYDVKEAGIAEVPSGTDAAFG